VRGAHSFCRLRAGKSAFPIISATVGRFFTTRANIYNMAQPAPNPPSNFPHNPHATHPIPIRRANRVGVVCVKGSLHLTCQKLHRPSVIVLTPAKSRIPNPSRIGAHRKRLRLRAVSHHPHISLVVRQTGQVFHRRPGNWVAIIGASNAPTRNATMFSTFPMMASKTLRTACRTCWWPRALLRKYGEGFTQGIQRVSFDA
jgi:hypothetical protein